MLVHKEVAVLQRVRAGVESAGPAEAVKFAVAVSLRHLVLTNAILVGVNEKPVLEGVTLTLF